MSLFPCSVCNEMEKLGNLLNMIPNDILTVILSYRTLQDIEKLRYLNKRFAKAALLNLPLWIGVFNDFLLESALDHMYDDLESALDHMYGDLEKALDAFQRFRQLYPDRQLEIRIPDSDQYYTGFKAFWNKNFSQEACIGHGYFSGLELDGGIYSNWDGLRIVTPQIDAVYKEQGYSVNVVNVKDRVIIHAFSYCTRLISITFPEDLISIEPCAFSFCDRLTKVTFPPMLQIIGCCAFEKTNLTEVDLSGCALKTLGAAAFRNSKLTSVIFPPGLMEIYGEVFEGCEQLTIVNLSCTLVKKIDDMAFAGCIKLASVIFPSTLEEIGYRAFHDCQELVHLMLPIGLKKIDREAFCRCGKLKDVIFPSSLQTIDDYAFERCGITSMVLWGTIRYSVFHMCYELKEVALQNTDVIMQGTFSSCGQLKRVQFPPMLRVIGPKAFELCSNLMSVNLSDTKLKIIARRSFYRCLKLESVDFPDSLAIIEQYAFAECAKLSSLTFPSGLRTIGHHAFANCTTLAFVSFPLGLTSIQDYAFEYCTRLTKPNLPPNLLKKGNKVFYGCT